MLKSILRVVFFLGLTLSVFAQQTDPNPESIRKDLRMLTSDEFRGRGTGDSGYTFAANYVAEQLFELGFHSFRDGLLPATKPQDFFHQVPLIREKLVSVSLQTGKKKWKYGKDFYTNRNFSARLLTADSLTFVKIEHIPELNSLQLKDQVVVVWRKKAGQGKPAPSTREITRQLSRFSPKALLIVDADYPDKPGLITKALAEENIRIDYSQEREDGISPTTRPVLPVLIIAEKVAPKIWQAAGIDWKKTWQQFEQAPNNQPLRLAFSLKAKAEVVAEKFEAPNVAAVLPGNKNQNEFIVISAHLDHLGVHDDKTFYGADDNGSGSAALLEMSRMLLAYRNQGMMTDKSIVFLWLTGEEHGLLGSQYFTTYPPVDIENIKVNLNVDMIGRVDKAHQADTNYVYLIGSDRLSTDLHNTSEEVNSKCCGINLDYTYNDPNDPNRYYQRSDHYNFAKYGIPVIFYFSGVHEDYHKATDTPDKINYHRIARITNLIFQTALELGNRQEPLSIDKQ